MMSLRDSFKVCVAQPLSWLTFVCAPFAHRPTIVAMYLLTLIGMLVFTFTLSLGHLWLVFITAGILG